MFTSEWYHTSSHPVSLNRLIPINCSVGNDNVDMLSGCKNYGLSTDPRSKCIGAEQVALSAEGTYPLQLKY